MLTVKGTMLGLARGKRSLRAEIEKATREGFIAGVREWVRAAVESTPVYTGTTMGTFAPLGRVIKQHVPPVSPINSAASAKKYFIYPKGGKKYPLGFDYAASEAQPYSKYNIKPNLGDISRVEHITGNAKQTLDFQFSFSHLLPYVIWNNTTPGPIWMNLKKETPWDTLKKADAAMSLRLGQLNKELRLIKTKGILGRSVLAGSVKFFRIEIKNG